MDAAADRFGLSGTTLAGRYRVERQVAEGGFAVVYRAVQIALDRPIALKVLKTPPWGLTDAARARFEHRFATEARTIGKLQHPYIVDVHDYGVSPMPLGDRAPWMALEWLEGKRWSTSLTGAACVRRAAAIAETVALLRPVIEAVAYAHEALRGAPRHQAREPLPGEARRRGDLIVKLLDFGIAKIMEGPVRGYAAGTRQRRVGFLAGLRRPRADHLFANGSVDRRACARPAADGAAHGRAAVLGRRRRAAVRTDHVGPPADPEQQGPMPVGWRRSSPGACPSPGQRWRDAGQLLAAVDARAGGAAPRRHASARRLQRRLLTTATALLASRPWQRARETWRVDVRAISACRCRVGWRLVRVRAAGVGAGSWWVAPARRVGARHVGDQRSAVDRPDPGLRVRGGDRRYERRAAADRGPATEPGAAGRPPPHPSRPPCPAPSRAW